MNKNLSIMMVALIELFHISISHALDSNVYEQCRAAVNAGMAASNQSGDRFTTLDQGLGEADSALEDNLHHSGYKTVGGNEFNSVSSAQMHVLRDVAEQTYNENVQGNPAENWLVSNRRIEKERLEDCYRVLPVSDIQ